MEGPQLVIVSKLGSAKAIAWVVMFSQKDGSGSNPVKVLREE
jgi:hypothetical protein